MDKKEYDRFYYHSKVDKKRKAELQRNRRKVIHKEICDIKTKEGCSICGYNNNPSALQFDHINPEDKKYNISSMVRMGFGLDKIKEEISKCNVLCANCHHIKTSSQFNWY